MDLDYDYSFFCHEFYTKTREPTKTLNEESATFAGPHLPHAMLRQWLYICSSNLLCFSTGAVDTRIFGWHY